MLLDTVNPVRADATSLPVCALHLLSCIFQWMEYFQENLKRDEKIDQQIAVWCQFTSLFLKSTWTANRPTWHREYESRRCAPLNRTI